jgi:hypothetical protein
MAERENVSLLGRWAAGPCRAVTAAAQVAYFGNGAYMEIVDFSDPGLPVKRGQVLLPGLVHGVTVDAGVAYVANRDAGLRVVDVSDPLSPAEIGFYDTPGKTLSTAVSGDYAYLADYTGVRIVDVTDPAAPVPVGFYDT